MELQKRENVSVLLRKVDDPKFRVDKNSNHLQISFGGNNQGGCFQICVLTVTASVTGGESESRNEHVPREA